jgi:photosystem II stability/assembly factor-like uncharacterized protein
MAVQFIARTLLAATMLAGAAHAQRAHEDHSAEFGFRFLGPVVGNRVAAFAAAPGDHNVYYVGASSGGVFKSVDGGSKWKPVFDDQKVAAIGALAVDPQHPNTVWAGTGEAWAVRDIDVTGNGIYKTSDGGKSWTNMGLPESGRIGRILVDPTDSNSVYVCALGRLAAPQQERGVYHTADGGKTWQRQLFVDANTGCSGLSMDAKDPKTLYAGTWQVDMHTWGENSGGPGSGVYVTHDGGAHWQHVTQGLPVSPLGKIDVAVAPTDSNRVYALIQTANQGSLWRSDNAGQSWQVVSWDRKLIGRAGYYIHLAVSPTDENRVIVANSSVSQSLDGGKTFDIVPWGGDTHDIWWDAKDADHFVITNDGGIVLTLNGGKSTQRISFPIGQMYHVEVDDQTPYYVYTNMQDNSTMRGPSIPIGGRPSDQGWDHHMGGCESGFTLPDPSDPNTVWASCYANEVTMWDAKTRRARSVSPWLHTMDAAPDQVPYRCHWTPPLAIDPFDPKSVYYGCQVVFKTTDKGQSWKVASPDLSHRDPQYIKSSGGIIGDNLGQFAPEVVFAIAPSKIKQGLVWAGTNDGKVWYTPDGGARWNDVTAGLHGIPELATVTSIQPSFFDPGTAYVSFDSHLYNDDRGAYIAKTTDYGKSWTLISGGLPKETLGYVRNVSEDPNAKGLLFAGTGDAFYYSLNDGGEWTRLKTGLPPSPVTWTVTQKRFHDLVISTYGRGIYILDDISPLEQMATTGKPAQATLFKPRDSYRLPDAKAFITYWLPNGASGDADAEILDSAGHVVRTLHGSAKAGFNRIDWDMRYNRIPTIELRTIPPENPHIWDDTRFKGKEWRPITHWGMPPNQPGPITTPGSYQIRLTVGGRTLTQPLAILPDPKSPGTPEQIGQTLTLQLRIRADVGRISSMVNLIERQRHQIEQMKASGNAGLSPDQVDAMDKKLQAVEYEMFQPDLAASDDKYYESAWRIYYNLLWLNAEIGTGAGDVAGGGDFGPTDTAPPLLDGLEKQLATATDHYKTVMARDVPAFNQALTAKGKPATALPHEDEEAMAETYANGEFADPDADADAD